MDARSVALQRGDAAAPLPSPHDRPVQVDAVNSVSTKSLYARLMFMISLGLLSGACALRLLLDLEPSTRLNLETTADIQGCQGFSVLIPSYVPSILVRRMRTRHGLRSCWSLSIGDVLARNMYCVQETPSLRFGLSL